MDKTKILVVEDENIVAMDIQQRLKNMGYAVPGRASTGEDAIARAAELNPDLVLMDIRLKGEMDGIEAATHIRARLNIPVIYLTAHADEATLQRAKITGPYGYLIKPFDEKDLHTTIAMALYRHKIEQELSESRRWLSTTLKSIGDAVIATDSQGRIKFMNPVAEKLTGWPQADALGKPAAEIFNIINAKTNLPAASPIAQVLEHGQTMELEDNTLLIARDGREIPIDDSAAPIKNEQDAIDGVVLVFRDITARKQAEEKLRRYTLELQTQNAELDAFSHTVAHDLKTPLNPIVGFAEALAEYDEILPDNMRQGLQIIARNARKMANVIDELLLLAQVRKAGLKVTALDMAGIITDVQHRLAYMIEETQAQLILPESWPAALGYGPWVEEVWINYLSNGLKYGGSPPRLELGSMVQPDGMVRFWVKDNGNGLTPQEQTELFKPFTQLNQVRIAGHGLGLSIVQRIVERLGGQVGVESTGEPGRGCTFYFTLPEAVPHPNDSQALEPARTGRPTSIPR